MKRIGFRVTLFATQTDSRPAVGWVLAAGRRAADLQLDDGVVLVGARLHRAGRAGREPRGRALCVRLAELDGAEVGAVAEAVGFKVVSTRIAVRLAVLEEAGAPGPLLLFASLGQSAASSHASVYPVSVSHGVCHGRRHADGFRRLDAAARFGSGQQQAARVRRVVVRVDDGGADGRLAWRCRATHDLLRVRSRRAAVGAGVRACVGAARGAARRRAARRRGRARGARARRVVVARRPTSCGRSCSSCSSYWSSAGRLQRLGDEEQAKRIDVALPRDGRPRYSPKSNSAACPR